MDPVSDHIRREAVHVAERWAIRMRQIPELERLSRPALFDHVFELLEGLAAWIDGHEQAAQRAFVALLDGHALQRLGHGISLETLIREYQVLHSILLAELLAVPSSDRVRASLVRLDEGFDQAVGDSLHRYEQQRELERERFIGVLGHDLRQPLGAIELCADMLATTPPEADQVRSLAARVQRACGRMTRLVEDVLDFARVHVGGGIPVEPVLHDLAEICRAAVDEVSAAHPDRPIALALDGDLRGGFDRDRILQALGNLLGNAVEHGVGSLALRGRESPDRRAVIVEVTSQGAPIPDEVLRCIFDPFSTTAPRRGLGLGLYIVQQIARAHGGFCEVSSDAGATTFRLHFPRSPDDARLAKALP